MLRMQDDGETQDIGGSTGGGSQRGPGPRLAIAALELKPQRPILAAAVPRYALQAWEAQLSPHASASTPQLLL